MNAVMSGILMRNHETARHTCKRLLAGMTTVLLLLMATARSGDFEQNDGPGLEDAHLVYQEKYVSMGEGVYLDGGTLFVVTVVPWGKGVASALRARAMLRGKEMLQGYIVEHLLDGKKKPPPCLLKTSFPRAVAFGRESVPGLGLPAFDMSMRIRVLEDKAIKEHGYRYAIALLLDDLQRNIPIGLYGEPSQEEMIAAMKKMWAARRTKSDLDALCRYFGLVEDLLLHTPSSEENDLAAHLDAGDSGNDFTAIRQYNAAHGLPKGVPSRSLKTISPLTIAWECFGHADFSVMNAVLPQEHHTASQLYDRGIELPRILTLASRGVELAPANAAAWSLLGQALYADGQTVAAIPFLVQSFRIDPENADARTFLAMAYMAGGYRNLAKGMAASVLFACTNESAWSVEKASEILAKSAE